MSSRKEYSLFPVSKNRFLTIGIITIALVLTFISEIHAQLAVSLELDRRNYLVYENVTAKVTFRNYSGSGLVFGNNPALKGTLKFKIISPGGKSIKPFKELNALEGTILDPGASSSVIVPLSQYYDLAKAGNYTLKAVISHPRLSSAYQSKETGFSVFNGLKIWEREVGVPDVLNTNSNETVKTRKVKILNFYDEKSKLYALMIEDEKFIYRVVRLEKDVENERPLVEIDGLSRIHIFTQIGPKVFSYFVYDLSGVEEEHTHYLINDGFSPTLVRDSKEGVVMVVGGKKAIEGKDYIAEDPNPGFDEFQNNSPEVPESANIKVPELDEKTSETEKKSNWNPFSSSFILWNLN